MQFCLLLPWFLVVKPILPDVGMVSSPLFEKVKGLHVSINLEICMILTLTFSVSEVTIHIKNQGEEAFKPKEYGKTIVITRRFTKEGSSTWKIKSKDGRVISTKKDELSAICDHMNIQVDNPMNVLTQGNFFKAYVHHFDL